MRIMLTNDDGIQASGIRTLEKHLRAAGHELLIVAPDRERSAASHSITLRKDLRLKEIGHQEYSVDGTPVDCVVVATQRILKEKVDLVISGINAGQNMGEDVLYSGTVAAALEASLFGIPGIAVSINSYKDQKFDTGAEWMVRLLDLGVTSLIPQQGILNINFPNTGLEDIKGIRLTTTGHRRYYNFITITGEFSDGFSYRVGGEMPSWDIQKGTDAEAVAEGYISITPLGMTLTHGAAFPAILEWLEANYLLQFEHN
jgi:5'-nucleotidase